MKTNDIRSLITQLSKLISKEGHIIIKFFLFGSYKADYDQVMDILESLFFLKFQRIQ